MSSYTQSISNLMSELSKLPGIGMRSAERIAFHLLKHKPVDALVERLASGTVKEVIMATNPNLEGDGTALHIQSLLGRFGQIAVTRLARGLPTGSNIEYANRNILADAINGRQKM